MHPAFLDIAGQENLVFQQLDFFVAGGVHERPVQLDLLRDLYNQVLKDVLDSLRLDDRACLSTRDLAAVGVNQRIKDIVHGLVKREEEQGRLALRGVIRHQLQSCVGREEQELDLLILEEVFDRVDLIL